MRLRFPIAVAGPLLGLLLLGNGLRGDASAEGVSPDFPERATIAASESLSCGATNRGALVDARRLADKGKGYVMADPWRSRGTNYATEELVHLIERTAAKVAKQFPGAQLSVADMSAAKGGPLKAHRSHQSGRDVDLIFYAIDAKGRPFYPDSHMAYFDENGTATHARSPARVENIPERYFDLARNWALVRAMLLDSEAVVDYIFVSPRIKRWLLDYASTTAEDTAIIDLAEKVLHAPREVRGHNDHMHVRIACPSDDIALGLCRDSSAPKPRRSKRWHTKVLCPAPPQSVR